MRWSMGEGREHIGKVFPGGVTIFTQSKTDRSETKSHEHGQEVWRVSEVNLSCEAMCRMASNRSQLSGPSSFMFRFVLLRCLDAP